MYIRLVLFVGIGVVSITAASLGTNNNFFYILLVLAFLLARYTIRVNKKLKVMERLIDFKVSWGLEIKKQREFEITQELLGLLKDEEKGFYVDERTW